LEANGVALLPLPALPCPGLAWQEQLRALDTTITIISPHLQRIFCHHCLPHNTARNDSGCAWPEDNNQAYHALTSSGGISRSKFGIPLLPKGTQATLSHVAYPRPLTNGALREAVHVEKSSRHPAVYQAPNSQDRGLGHLIPAKRAGCQFDNTNRVWSKGVSHKRHIAVAPMEAKLGTFGDVPRFTNAHGGKAEARSLKV
jgi:hypothetical protein